jgi:hypothetical protein
LSNKTLYFLASTHQTAVACGTYLLHLQLSGSALSPIRALISRFRHPRRVNRILLHSFCKFSINDHQYLPSIRCFTTYMLASKKIPDSRAWMAQPITMVMPWALQRNIFNRVPEDQLESRLW